MKFVILHGTGADHDSNWFPWLKLELEKYWSKATKIPRSRFNKTIVRPAGNKVGKSQGTCKVRFADKHIYQELEKILSEVLQKTGVPRRS